MEDLSFLEQGKTLGDRDSDTDWCFRFLSMIPIPLILVCLGMIFYCMIAREREAERKEIAAEREEEGIISNHTALPCGSYLKFSILTTLLALIVILCIALILEAAFPKNQGLCFDPADFLPPEVMTIICSALCGAPCKKGTTILIVSIFIFWLCTCCRCVQNTIVYWSSMSCFCCCRDELGYESHATDITNMEEGKAKAKEEKKAAKQQEKEDKKAAKDEAKAAKDEAKAAKKAPTDSLESVS